MSPYSLALLMVLVQTLVLTASDLVVENRRYYILLSDSTKVFITPLHEGAGQNLVVFSPDSSHLAYTRTCGYGFEAEGRAVYICKPDGTGRTFIFRQPFHIGKLYWEQIQGKSILVFYNNSGGVDVGKNFRVYDLMNRHLVFETAGYIWDRQGLCFQLGSEDYSDSAKTKTVCIDTCIASEMLEPDDGSTYVKGDSVLNRCDNADSVLLTAQSLITILGNAKPDAQMAEITDALLSPNRKMLCLVANIGHNLIGVYDRAKAESIYRENSPFTTQRDFVWSGDSKKIAYILEFGDGYDYRNPDSNMVVVLNLETNRRFTKTYRGNHTILDLHWSPDSDTLLYEFKPDWSSFSEIKPIIVGEN